MAGITAGPHAARPPWQIRTHLTGIFVDSHPISHPVVHVIDDDSSSRSSLCELVASMGFSTAAYQSVEQYMRGLDSSWHGCVILFLHAPASIGLPDLETLTNLPIPMPVIVMTDCTSVGPAVRAMQLGVEDYVQKHCLSETSLWESIHAAFARDSVQRAAYHRQGQLQAKLAELTLREREVLELLVRGHDHRAIAEELNVSRRTVENRRARIMEKMGVETFPKLIAIAIELGIPESDIDPDATLAPGDEPR
jgi:two-component system, LuxR family, response regulator FixJ